MDIDAEITEITTVRGVPQIEMPAAFIIYTSRVGTVPIKADDTLYSFEFPEVPF